MSPFRFATPHWLLLLLPLIALGIFDLFRNRTKPALVFSTTLSLKQIPKSAASYVKKIIPSLFYLGVSLLIIALARPQWGVSQSRLSGNGISIVMCVDRSGSMAAEDFKINGIPSTRLDAVKKVFKEFVVGSSEFHGRPDDLIALITFGGFVDSCCPLTLDHNSLIELLDKITIPVPLFDRNGVPIKSEVLSEEASTAIGDALASAVNLLKDSDNKTKIVVLLSDGMQTAGVLSPEEGIKIAKTFGVKVYTIGVGANGFVPFPQYLPNGNVVMTRQYLEFDSETLRLIASATGGQYFHAEDVEGLKKVYEEIDRLEKTKFDAGAYAQFRDLYPQLVLLGGLLLIVRAFLNVGRFRSFP